MSLTNALRKKLLIIHVRFKEEQGYETHLYGIRMAGIYAGVVIACRQLYSLVLSEPGNVQIRLSVVRGTLGTCTNFCKIF